MIGKAEIPSGWQAHAHRDLLEIEHGFVFKARMWFIFKEVEGIRK